MNHIRTKAVALATARQDGEETGNDMEAVKQAIRTWKYDEASLVALHDSDFASSQIAANYIEEALEGAEE